MLVTLPLAGAAITLAGAENAVDGHCEPSRRMILGYTDFRFGYTTGYTNDPQKPVIEGKRESQ